MSDWAIRLARERDVPKLANCLHRAYAIYAKRIQDLPPIAERLEDEIMNNEVWIATSGDAIVGGLILVPKQDHLVLANVGVVPEAAGRGLGRGLIEFAENRCRERQLGELRLTTHADLPENVRLYEHLGWIVCRRSGNKVHMAKSIAT